MPRSALSRIFLLLASVLLVLPAADAQPGRQTAAFTANTTVLEGADRRPQTSLDGDWHSIADPYFTGLYSFHHEEKKDGWFLNRRPEPGSNMLIEYDFSRSSTLKVPGDWNTQQERLFFYEGPLWYQRDFDFHPGSGKRVFLHIGAANYRSYFWINGMKVCQHEGGFTTFDCEVTSALKDGANFIVAVVDNTRLIDGVPTLQTDWWNYGGLTRSVSLVEVPQTFISGYDLHLDRATRSRIEGWIQLTGVTASDTASQTVEVDIPELQAHTTAQTDAHGRAAVSFPVTGVQFWSPETPRLYKVDLAVAGDVLHEEMGFKTIETRGTEILLNGKPVYLRGISIHAEAPYRTGRASSEKDMETLLGWARELGCNYVRLAHYPHDERMTRLADRVGILVWSEVPGYWALQFDNPTVFELHKQQVEEMIARDRNRASVGLWSIANETPANAPNRTKYLTDMAHEVRSLDPERLVTAALLVSDGGVHQKVVDDPLGEALDVLGINSYIGWYEGAPELASQTTWNIKYQKPVIVSEFGGGAPAGRHGPDSERWTEEYQASIYEHNLPMWARVPQIRGMSPWILMDFRSPTRQLPGVQDYFNRKGLVSDQGHKKLAFTVLQKAYKAGYGNAQ
ncbi:MAG: beta-glucuronidase [Acidobacteriaceae bacterium]|nr:beta-glucuronidase [Acidobacteriaceae bacterium]